MDKCKELSARTIKILELTRKKVNIYMEMKEKYWINI